MCTRAHSLPPALWLASARGPVPSGFDPHPPPQNPDVALGSRYVSLHLPSRTRSQQQQPRSVRPMTLACAISCLSRDLVQDATALCNRLHLPLCRPRDGATLLALQHGHESILHRLVGLYPVPDQGQVSVRLLSCSLRRGFRREKGAAERPSI